MKQDLAGSWTISPSYYCISINTFTAFPYPFQDNYRISINSFTFTLTPIRSAQLPYSNQYLYHTNHYPFRTPTVSQSIPPSIAGQLPGRARHGPPAAHPNCDDVEKSSGYWEEEGGWRGDWEEEEWWGTGRRGGGKRSNTPLELTYACHIFWEIWK